jgi:S1-C subfamily serine protease
VHAPIPIGRTAGFVIAVAMVALVILSMVAEAAPVDSSTVRVFAIGTVGTEQVEVAGKSQVLAHIVGGHGTGFFVDSGLVMTANHVVSGARHVVVRLPGTAGFHAASVIYANEKDDIAVLALGSHRPLAEPLALRTAVPRVRETVFAVGYPIDASRTQPQSARGIVAGFLDDGTIQLDMALNPGNSGGPVVDEHDAVIAMAIARGDLEKGVQGIGYAVPGQKLTAAIAVAKRRLAAGRHTRVTSSDSATVVDQLVQHGALDSLRGAARSSADLERALAALFDRIADPDLLVCVAGALWNASIAIESPDAGPADAVAERLRAAARRFVHRAVELDRQVASRSEFVGFLLGSEPDPVAAVPVGTTPVGANPVGANPVVAAPVVAPPVVAAPVAPYTGTYRAAAWPDPPDFTRWAFSVAPIVRFNPSSGSTGWGYGAAGRLEIGKDNPFVPFIGAAYGSVDVGSFTHRLLAGELGAILRVRSLDVIAAYAPCWYESTVNNADSALPGMSVGAYTSGFRAALDYRFGNLAFGSGVRVLSGPTLWVDAIFLTWGF